MFISDQGIPLTSTVDKVPNKTSNKKKYAMVVAALGMAAVVAASMGGGESAHHRHLVSDPFRQAQSNFRALTQDLEYEPRDLVGAEEAFRTQGRALFDHDSNQLDTCEFTPAVQRSMLVGSVAMFMVKKLAGGVLNRVGNEATGWLLNKVGLVDNSDGESLDEIKEQLNEQKEMLQEIQHQLRVIENQINRAVEEIMNAIDNAADKNQFAAWVATLNQNVGTILGYSDSLRVWSQMEPSESLQSDIANFRTFLLNNIPQAIRSIDGALMGTGFSEGMVSLFARIQYKESATAQAYSQMFFMMFDYYFAYEVLGLQLMIEAYHATDPAQMDASRAYYELWTDVVGAQIEAYMSRSPLTELVESFVVTEGRDNKVGRFRFMEVTEDRVYFLNQTGFVHTCDNTGSGLFSYEASMTDDVAGQIPVLQATDESLIVGGCPRGSSCSSYVFLQKLDKDSLSRQSMLRVPRTSRANYAYPRGSALNKTSNTLYLLQTERIGNYFNTSLQAVDGTTLRYLPNKSVLLDTYNVVGGDIALVGNNLAIIGTSHWRQLYTGEPMIHIVDLDSVKVVGEIKGKGSFSVSGMAFNALWQDHRSFVEVTNLQTGATEFYNLRHWKQIDDNVESVGRMGYAAGASSANVTLGDSKVGPLLQSLNVNAFASGLPAALTKADGALVAAGRAVGSNYNLVVGKLNSAYPFEELPSLEDLEKELNP